MSKSPYVVLLLLMGMILAGFAFLQEAPYRINIHKDFGFSSGNRIRGTFTLAIIGEMEDVRTVTFLCDGQVLQQVSREPYEVQVKTQSFSLGIHEFSALVELMDGSKAAALPRRFDFVSAEAESVEIQRIVFPLFGGIILIVVMIFTVQWVVFRENENLALAPGAPRHYGISGGTICPNYRRAFSMHWWAPNLIFHKFDRCDFCGRWSIVRRRSTQELAQAEAAEVSDSRNYYEGSTSAYRKNDIDRLDDTRFVDRI